MNRDPVALGHAHVAVLFSVIIPSPFIVHLKSDNTNTSALRNNVTDASSRIRGVRIRSLVRALLGDLGRAVGVDVTRLGSESLCLGIQISHNGAVGVGEGRLLDEHLGAHAGVDAGNAAAVARAVDVAGAEADRGKARVDVDEGVVVVCYTELAGVFASVAVRVANERALPLQRC